MSNFEFLKNTKEYALFAPAVMEAKRTSKECWSETGYAVCGLFRLERKFGRRPMMFTTNGFETYFWDDKTSPQRPVSGIFRVY